MLCNIKQKNKFLFIKKTKIMLIFELVKILTDKIRLEIIEKETL